MCGAINLLPHTPSWLHRNFLKMSVAAATLLHGTLKGYWSKKYLKKKVIEKRNTLIYQVLKSNGLNLSGSYIYI
jgi:hypothetical protein